MILPYKNRLVRNEFLYGIVIFILGILFVFAAPEKWFRYYLIILGLLYITSAFYKWKFPYLKLENETLVKSEIRTKKIHLSEVTAIKKFGGDYTLFSGEKKLKINSEYLDKSSRKELEIFLNSLDLEINDSTRKVTSFNHK